MNEQMTITADGQVKGALEHKVDMAIQRLKAFEPPEGYYVAFSGGKDSQCVYHLCKIGGVKFDAHYAVTSVDPPELVKFIKVNYPDVEFERQHYKDGKPITMWNLIPKKRMPPTRINRYCCEKLKEAGGKGRVTVTGVRWAESVNRKRKQNVVLIKNPKKTVFQVGEETGALFSINESGGVVMNDDNDTNRRMVEQCYRTNKTLVNPIVDWTDADVWDFLNENHISHCELYDRGYKRLGCIGCPMSYRAAEELENYPKYKASYLRAFGRMINEREKNGLTKHEGKEDFWETPEDVMAWWIKR